MCTCQLFKDISSYGICVIPLVHMGTMALCTVPLVFQALCLLDISSRCLLGLHIYSFPKPDLSICLDILRFCCSNMQHTLSSEINNQRLWPCVTFSGGFLLTTNSPLFLDSGLS